MDIFVLTNCIRRSWQTSLPPSLPLSLSVSRRRFACAWFRKQRSSIHALHNGKGLRIVEGRWQLIIPPSWNVDSRVNIRLGAWIEAANLICQRSIHATRVNFLLFDFYDYLPDRNHSLKWINAILLRRWEEEGAYILAANRFRSRAVENLCGRPRWNAARGVRAARGREVRAAVFRELDTPGSNLSFYPGRMFLVPSKNRTIRGQL